ncbi:MAG TPA: DMT family transporter [Jatrophihabitantaceae bacterium]|nr:DMT family transporter [Jatrophihabitantaceae bacterium]
MTTSRAARATPATTIDALLLTIAVLAVSTSGPLVREADAPGLSIAFWRTFLGAAVVIVIAVMRHRSELRGLRREQVRIAVVAGVFLGFHFAAWIPSLSFTTVASSVALVCTQPVWAAVIARARGEHVASTAWIGIAIALCGVLVLTGVDLSVSGRALFGDALALAGGVLAAAYVTAGSDARRSMSTTTYTSLCYSVAAGGLLVACVVGRQSVTGYDAHTWWVLVAITVGPQLLGHTLVNRVLRTFTATVVSMAILFEIVGATLIAWWWFDEAPPAGAYPAAALIAAGVVLVVRASNRPVPAVE